jgi:hypothetical protein
MCDPRRNGWRPTCPQQYALLAHARLDLTVASEIFDRDDAGRQAFRSDPQRLRTNAEAHGGEIALSGRRGCQRAAIRQHRRGQHIHGRRSDEARGKNGFRALVKGSGGIVLLNFSCAQENHAVGHGHRLYLIVGDIDHGLAEPALEAANLPAHFAAQLRIEVGERLIHQADRCLRDQSAAERDALLLSARELRGLAIEQPLEAEQIRRALEACRALGVPDAANLQPKHDVFRDRQMRKQCIGLKHHRHAAPRRRLAGDVAAGNLDRAGVGQIEASDQAQGRRFAAS